MLHANFFLQPRSVIRSKKSDFDHFDMIYEDDQSPQSQTSGSGSGSSTHMEQLLENTVSAYAWWFFDAKISMHRKNLKILPWQTEETPTSAKKSWGRGRGKAHGVVQNCSGRGLLSQSQQQLGAVSQSENTTKSAPQSPRMPDGTRGFTMGRGKPILPVIGGPLLTASIGLGPIQLWVTARIPEKPMSVIISLSSFNILFEVLECKRGTGIE